MTPEEEQLNLSWKKASTKVKTPALPLPSPGGPVSPLLKTFDRRVVVKANYFKAPSGKLPSKLAYILRKEAVEGERRMIVNNPQALKTPLKGEGRFYHLVISPEDNIPDMKGFLNKVLRRLEGEKGQGLLWGFAVHNDTEHRHAHVIIRGADLQGRPRALSPRDIKERIRRICQEEAAAQIGRRTIWDVQRALREQIPKDYFTALDSRVEKKLNSFYQVGTLELNALERARLEALVEKGLARRGLGTYQLCSSWKVDLKAEQLKSDLMKSLHRVGEVAPRKQKVFPLPAGEVFEGKVASIAYNREALGAKAVYLEDKKGLLYKTSHPPRTRGLQVGQRVLISPQGGLRVEPPGPPAQERR